MEQEHEIMYHVFTNERDLWTKDYMFARKLYTHWKRTHSSARLYKEVDENVEAMLSDELLEEDCLLSYGPYPT